MRFVRQRGVQKRRQAGADAEEKDACMGSVKMIQAFWFSSAADLQ
jgi:hypothetical protein